MAVSAAIVALVALVASLPAAATAGASVGAPPAAFTFRGGGYGHGVGLSQYGALGRAEAGHSAAEILAAYYPTTVVQTYAVPKNVRVHLTSAAAATVTPQGTVTVLGLGGGPRRDVPGPVTVSRAAGAFSVLDGTGAELCGAGQCTAGTIRIRFPQGAPSTLATAGFTNRFRWGRFAFVASGSSMTIVLERLSMDRYLYGLAEMPASWPEAALDTQAIAGRSYATASILARRADPLWTRPYDLESGQQDQVYHGLPNEEGTYGARWTAAVDRTSGQVVLGDGGTTVVQAFYSSSNGGHTEDSGYVFYTSYPWFAALPDPFDAVGNPLATWERTFTQAQLQRWIARSSFGSVGDVLDIDIGGWIGASGRIDRATVTVSGSKRRVEMTGNQLIAVVNGGSWSEGGGVGETLPSSKVSVHVAGEAPFGGLDRVTVRDGQAIVVGWAWDADASGRVPVEIRVDGSVASAGTTGVRRLDLAVALGIGRRSGFRIPVSLPAGTSEVCAYASDNGDAGPALLGCTSATG